MTDSVIELRSLDEANRLLAERLKNPSADYPRALLVIEGATMTTCRARNRSPIRADQS